MSQVRVMTWNLETYSSPARTADPTPRRHSRTSSAPWPPSSSRSPPTPTGSEIDLKPGSAFQRPDADDGFRLWNLAALLPAGQRFTRVFKGRGELIDHVFASHRLVNPATLPTVQTIQGVEPLPSVGDDPTSRRNEPGSDHAAVVATFNL